VIGQYSNSYAIQTGYYEYECWLAGETHQFELPEVAIQPRREYIRFNVHGCGLVLHPEDKLWIFFTLNGKLRGELVPDVLRINKQITYAYFEIIILISTIINGF
jgi:hypothetical protein